MFRGAEDAAAGEDPRRPAEPTVEWWRSRGGGQGAPELARTGLRWRRGVRLGLG